MEFSKNEWYLTRGDATTKRIVERWNEAADKISIEYGVLVKVVEDYDAGVLQGIRFEVMYQEFESLQEVRRVLELKAFF